MSKANWFRLLAFLGLSVAVGCLVAIFIWGRIEMIGGALVPTSMTMRLVYAAVVGAVLYVLFLIIGGRVSERHPDSEQLAAFVTGNLNGRELARVAEHLRTCEDCRAVVSESARIDRQG